MPVSAELLKALADDPKALEQQLGCMTGLFQIFDRQGVGRRYGSKRVSNAASGQSQPTSACETPRHDHRSSNPYWMFEDDASLRMAKNGDKEQHHRAYSDSSEIFLTKASFEATTTESSAKSPLFSEDEAAPTFYHNVDPDEHRPKKKLSVVVPSRAVNSTSTGGSDIRDIVRASFDQHKPRQSLDGSHGYSYNLPRSSSVDHGRGDRLRDVSSASAPRPPPVDLPRSSSVGGRGAAQILADWKDGLRSPRLAKQNVASKHQNSSEGGRDVAELIRKHQNSSEGGHDVGRKHQNSGDTRLTVELLQGPRLSVCVDDRRGKVPRPCETSVEFKESLRAAEIKEFLRGSQRVGHRYSVDGTRDAPRVCTAPRLSVDGREYSAPRRLKMEPGNGEFVRQSSERADISRKAPNVVARLMGLDELPKEVQVQKQSDLLEEFLGGSPPPPSPPEDYDYAHRSEVLQHWQRRDQEDSRFASSHQEVQLQFEELPAKKGHVVEHVVEAERRLELKLEVPRRRSLWHIFEAMQLKGWSSKKKQAEASRLRNLEKEEKECEDVKKRSQSLPPRLSSAQDYQDTPRVFTLPLNRDSRAVPEQIKPGSGHEQYYRQADEEPHVVVVKPTMTRSMSYKPQPAVAAAGLVETPLSHVEDINSHRGVSKSVAYHRETQAFHRETERFHRETVPKEPLQGGDSSSCSQEMSSSARQSRKERGPARMTKSFSDVPQSERDSSPRGPRPHMQEKSSRSRGDSSSVSPRCTGSMEGMRVMDASSKMRRKQAIAVKDREDTKASLVNMRANATKQDFLKGRASGDPDTPRLLRRSSSESKLLSKIAEKPIITDTPKPLLGGRSGGAAPNIPPVKSKRPVSKDNRYLKTRPTSCPNVKSVPKPASPKAAAVAAEHVDRPKLVSTDVSEPASTLAQEQQPAESKGAQSGEVRATQGGALDHSGDTSHSNAREQRSESKAREKTIEIDEGVKTPRGVSIKKIDFSEDAQAEVAEQPSPVSVLDNSHFNEEELTPSPKAAKSSVVCLQEQSRNEKDRRWNSARFLYLDPDENTTPSSTARPDATTLENKSEQDFHQHSICVCLKDADEEKAYVEELMEASNIWNFSDPQLDLPSSDSVIDPSVFDQLEATHLGDEKEALERQILFDCVNEVLASLLLASPTTALLQTPSLRKRPVGRALLKEVLIELEGISCAPSDDVCDTVYVILQKDLANRRGPQWLDHRTELEEVGVAVERMIIKDLIEETVRELLGHTPGNNASRRQLFA